MVSANIEVGGSPFADSVANPGGVTHSVFKAISNILPFGRVSFLGNVFAKTYSDVAYTATYSNLNVYATLIKPIVSGLNLEFSKFIADSVILKSSTVSMKDSQVNATDYLVMDVSKLVIDNSMLSEPLKYDLHFNEITLNGDQEANNWLKEQLESAKNENGYTLKNFDSKTDETFIELTQTWSEKVLGVNIPFLPQVLTAGLIGSVGLVYVQFIRGR